MAWSYFTDYRGMLNGALLYKLQTRTIQPVKCRRLKPAREENKRLGRWPEGQLYPTHPPVSAGDSRAPDPRAVRSIPVLRSAARSLRKLRQLWEYVPPTR